MQKVTIVIPNYNGRRLLENCLKTLENQTYTDFKVLIIDNGSTDGSKGLYQILWIWKWFHWKQI